MGSNPQDSLERCRKVCTSRPADAIRTSDNPISAAIKLFRQSALERLALRERPEVVRAVWLALEGRVSVSRLVEWL